MRRLIIILIGVGIATGCRKGDQEPDGGIDQPPITVERPDATPPSVHFPRDCQTEDITLNKFIEDALGICATGDYDRFRQLFASAYSPVKKADFDRIWTGVKSVQILSVHADLEEPPNYYVHAIVQFRQADGQQRTKRDAIVAVFREDGEWRISPTSKEIHHKILVIDSQPVGDDPEGRRPKARSTGEPSSESGNLSRPPVVPPAKGPSGKQDLTTRPSTSPGV